MSQPLIVSAAIIRNDEHVLITRRPPGTRDAGKWEFPGGKMHDNETPEDALRRELLEELNLPVTVEAIYDVLHHRYSWGSVLLLFYVCTPLSDRIENRQVADHRFVPVRDLHSYDILEADREIVSRLQNESA